SNEGTIQAALENFTVTYKTFQGIVLEAGNEGPDEKDLPALVSGMVSHMGTARALPGGNCLVLVNENIDRELLAHRLAKNTETGVLLQFSADNVSGALKELKPYL
ncbi:MAG: hypothetical protein LBJ90_09055, partial [Treponema sp.]|nr:hypothetical protein [Treponema sp.]